MATRNMEELTQEDMSKNMCWKVAGQRGDQRIMKGYNREAREHQREWSVEKKTPRNRTRRTVERGGARGTTWGVSKDVATWTRNDSDSDQDLLPLTKVTGVRGGLQQNSTITGANRVA